MRRFCHLEFHGDKRLEGLFDQQVDFELILGPQEIQVWPPSLMEKHLDRFLDAEILEQGAAQRTLQQMILVLDSRQVANQTDIEESRALALW